MTIFISPLVVKAPLKDIYVNIAITAENKRFYHVYKIKKNKIIK